MGGWTRRCGALGAPPMAGVRGLVCALGRWVGGWVAGWLGGWVAGLLGGWVAGWLGGWVAGWLAGRLAGWLGWVGGGRVRGWHLPPPTTTPSNVLPENMFF